MPSNLNLRFEHRIKQHFSCGELVEFLGLSMDDLLDRFDDIIDYYHEDILAEMAEEELEEDDE